MVSPARPPARPRRKPTGGANRPDMMGWAGPLVPLGPSINFPSAFSNYYLKEPGRIILSFLHNEVSASPALGRLARKPGRVRASGRAGRRQLGCPLTFSLRLAREGGRRLPYAWHGHTTMDHAAAHHHAIIDVSCTSTLLHSIIIIPIQYGHRPAGPRLSTSHVARTGRVLNDMRARRVAADS